MTERYGEGVEFWESFWATMWGALAGALVGATAAYVFARDLSKRDRQQRMADDALRREADELARYRSSLIPMHVTRTVDALHRYADELHQTSPFSVSRPIGDAPPPRHTARAEVLAAIDAATVGARSYERQVFQALRRAVDVVDRGRSGVGQVERLITVMLNWQVLDELEGFVEDDLDKLAQEFIDERQRETESSSDW